MKNLLNIELRKDIKRYLSYLYSFVQTPNRNAIFVLGNQKSGTSVIAALLSFYGGVDVTLDIVHITSRELEKLVNKKLSMRKFIKRHSWEFSRRIIKEPWLTLFYDELREIYPKNKFVFIIRDPRDNIRSILNRLSIPGNLKNLPQQIKIPPLWLKILDNRWLGIPYEHYIESLAARWVKFADIYLNNSTDFELVRYEDFLTNKVDCIERLALNLGIEKKGEIVDKLNIQFQPKGDKNVSWIDFFGEENLKKIDKICYNQMVKFNYLPIAL